MLLYIEIIIGICLAQKAPFLCFIAAFIRDRRKSDPVHDDELAEQEIWKEPTGVYNHPANYINKQYKLPLDSQISLRLFPSSSRALLRLFSDSSQIKLSLFDPSIFLVWSTCLLFKSTRSLFLVDYHLRRLEFTTIFWAATSKPFSVCRPEFPCAHTNCMFKICGVRSSKISTTFQSLDSRGDNLKLYCLLLHIVSTGNPNFQGTWFWE